ncbi:tetratricopeptide repeat protein [Micromonospora terminaliae]|uniref:Tetratricopeptide repeat protein n=1 Tax=Micromonospora terminaliae TaxID=1914461 RepID=A0AAJ2ZED2_9ACTN|nr:tetratricopeptide repeat protein [Micromonospora terminaliae]NES28600.1 tetratricopeptide repeat protein [Micromonospora terminaliae]QGL45677.1 tetratricopeptide repeat protein [Micromonospora terminaliae]
MSLVVRIALLRQLTRLGPHWWGPRLAEALVTRSHQMSGLPGSTGRRTAAAKEAVALCRRLAAERPDQHQVALARALVARAAAPDNAPATEAIDQLREAIGYVEDADDRSALVVLATARGLLALNLHQCGEIREALRLALRARATWDACGQLRRLERMRLARTLLVIGDCQEALGRREEANTVRRQALELHRALNAYRRSQSLTVGMAAALDLAQGLTVTGPAQEALDLIEESRPDVEVWSRLQPRQGRPLLARAMLIEAECRAQLGDPDTAVRLAEQAVDRQRAVVAAGTPGSAAALAHGLLVLDDLTARAGRRDRAVAHLTEAAALARTNHDEVLARALFELVDLRVAAGDRAAVEELLAEAVPLCREHTGQLPEVWRPRLARALLMRCALTVFELPATAGPGGPAAEAAAGGGTPGVDGPDGDGLAAGREAVELARLLSGAQPAYRELLGRCLFALARAVHLAGDPGGSADLLRECVAVRRDLFSVDPVAFRLPLAEALCNLGNRMHALDRLEEAVGSYRECLDLLRADPERIDQAELLTPLRNLGLTLLRLDRTAEAERIHDEIAAIEESVGTAGSS